MDTTQKDVWLLGNLLQVAIVSETNIKTVKYTKDANLVTIKAKYIEEKDYVRPNLAYKITPKSDTIEYSPLYLAAEDTKFMEIHCFATNEHKKALDDTLSKYEETLKHLQWHLAHSSEIETLTEIVRITRNETNFEISPNIQEIVYLFDALRITEEKLNKMFDYKGIILKYLEMGGKTELHSFTKNQVTPSSYGFNKHWEISNKTIALDLSRAYSKFRRKPIPEKTQKELLQKIISDQEAYLSDT